MIKLNIIDAQGHKNNVADIKRFSMIIQNKSAYNRNIKQIWGEYVAGSGTQDFYIECSGIISDLISANLLLNYAFDNFIFKYEFIFEQNKSIVSYGRIDIYEKTFKSSEIGEFSMKIASSGKVEIV